MSTTKIKRAEVTIHRINTDEQKNLFSFLNDKKNLNLNKEIPLLLSKSIMIFKV